MKELSEELKKIALLADQSIPGHFPGMFAACLAVGNAMVEQDRKDAEHDYVAWACYSKNGDGETVIKLCDSDHPKAFKVYRHPARQDAAPRPNLTDIGQLRAYLLVPFDCKWNALIRDVTAEHEHDDGCDAYAVFKHLVQIFRDNGQLDHSFPPKLRLEEMFDVPMCKDAAGPELTIDDRAYLAGIVTSQSRALELIDRVQQILSRRRSLSESQWAEVEKAMREEFESRGVNRGWQQWLINHVRARLLPPKTPPTPEERVYLVEVPFATAPSRWEVIRDGKLMFEESDGVKAHFLYHGLIAELRGKLEGGQ